MTVVILLYLHMPAYLILSGSVDQSPFLYSCLITHRLGSLLRGMGLVSAFHAD